MCGCLRVKTDYKSFFFLKKKIDEKKNYNYMNYPVIDKFILI